MKITLTKLGALMFLFLAGCSSSSMISNSIDESSQTTSLISENSSEKSETTSLDTSDTSLEASLPDDYPFVPGHMGELPAVAGLEPVPNQFAGLYVQQSDRQPGLMGATEAESLLMFPEPWELGATQFRLQYFHEGSWANYGDGDDYVTDYNNFIVPSIDGQRMRLLAIGGDIDGYTSNEIVLTYSDIDTMFQGYSLDESMWITGIMWPFVGRGLEAGFTVMSLDDSQVITDALDYQWYRVNPYTYEHTPIDGATSLTYTTTMGDLGYYVSIIATGDGVNAGGQFEIISNQRVVTLGIKAFSYDITNLGFTLHFDYEVSNFNVDNLSILDDQYNEVAVASATLSPDGTSVAIVLQAASASTELYVEYSDEYWILVDHEYGMQSLLIDLP